MSLTRRAVAATCVALAGLAMPAAAQASYDLAVSQAESADPVARGARVTYAVTVANVGSEPVEDIFVNLFSLAAGSERAAANPYVSFSASQGGCRQEAAGDYRSVVCALGTLGAGTSARIAAVVQANESMDHEIGLIHCDFECFGGFGDDEISNNQATERTTVSAPPELSGSRKVVLKGLPEGCAAADFKLKARAKGKLVKRVSAELRGPDSFKERLGRTQRSRLKTTVPVAGLEQASLYELKVVATRKGRKALKRTVIFQRC